MNVIFTIWSLVFMRAVYRYEAGVWLYRIPLVITKDATFFRLQVEFGKLISFVQWSEYEVCWCACRLVALEQGWPDYGYSASRIFYYTLINIACGLIVVELRAASYVINKLWDWPIVKLYKCLSAPRGVSCSVTN